MRKKVIFEVKEIQKQSVFAQSNKESEEQVTAESAQLKFQKMIRGSWDVSLAKRPCIIIDNGSYECRAGWSNQTEPYIRFKNQISKPKTMTNRDIDAMHIVGDEF